MRIAPRPPEDPHLAPLLRAAVDELDARYPEDHTDPAVDPRARYLLAEVDGAPAGCAALVPLGPGVGEIKRVYVAPAFRGRGVATRLLRELEERARAQDLATLVLETGVRQPESLALYEKLGFSPVPAYGPHVGNPLSLCYAKALAPAPARGA